MAVLAGGRHLRLMQHDSAARSPVEAARALRPLIRELREETEAGRRLPARLVEALVDAGLFRLAVPRVDGGLEASPLDALAVYEELAGEEASAAWIVWNNTLPGFVSKFLSSDMRHELFAPPRTVMANSTRPTGRALPSAGGYRISGRWSLVSGCELADRVLLRCVVAPAQDAPHGGPPDLIMAYMPRESCRIVDTWHASGLRGTGSHDVVVEDELVPGEATVAFHRAPLLATPLYRMPFAATLSAGCAAIALGIARAATEAVVELARTKASVDTGAALRDRGSFLARLAQMKARQSAARLLLHSTLERAFLACSAGQPVTLEDRAEIWAASYHAALAAKDVVRLAHELLGASALYTSCPLERAHRDLHAVTQHVILQELWQEDAGRVWLEAPPLAPLFAS
jgi:indole-3-acetate monooxygenase